jgi:hypothetical protein
MEISTFETPQNKHTQNTQLSCALEVTTILLRPCIDRSPTRLLMFLSGLRPSQHDMPWRSIQGCRSTDCGKVEKGLFDAGSKTHTWPKFKGRADVTHPWLKTMTGKGPCVSSGAVL